MILNSSNIQHYKVIDNFLPLEVFTDLQNLILSKNFAWFHGKYISYEDQKHENESYNSFFFHECYNGNIPITDLFDKLVPILNNYIQPRVLIRIKVNFYTPCSKVTDHAKHVDFEFPHQAAILCLNTCDGYTKLDDGTRIDSVANRFIMFDGSKLHNSTSTSQCDGAKGRFNINLNYL